MSVFDKFQAERLAAMTFRFRADTYSSQIEQNTLSNTHRPLVGKEKELLEVLLAAEQRYLDCKRELEIIGSLRRSDRELPIFCIQIARDLSVIQSRLSELDDIAREEMNGIAHRLGSSAAEMHACINKVQQWFDEGGRAAGMVVSTHEKTAGRKRGVSNAGITGLPLEEFAKEVRNFLISPNVRIEFSFQAVTRSDKPAIRRRPASTRGRLLRKTHPREPVSAAACLLHEAALLLDPRVQVADIEAIIRAVNQNPEFREELLEDEIVHALTD